MLLKTIPVLPVISIKDSIDFYAAKLGFKGSNQGNYAVLKLKDAEIHLLMVDSKKSFHAGSCYILTDDIECLYADCSARELLHPKQKLDNNLWGLKEFSIRDNNGNLIRFGQKK